MKKIVSMLLAALMILTALPLAALADDGNGDGYNDNDVLKISAFLKLGEDGVTNAEKLGYASADDPAAWTDVTWESDGSELRAVSISFWNPALTGALDLSGCGGLRELYCSGNIEALSLDGCAALEMLGCRDNNFTSLDISGCTAIKYIESYGSPLKHIRANLGGAEVTLDAPDGCVRIYYCNGVFGYEFPVLIVTAVPVSLPFDSWTGTRDGAPYSSDSLFISLTPGTAYSLTAGFSGNTGYNNHDLVKMQTYLVQEPLESGYCNANVLDYNAGPSTWSGVTWDDSTPKRLAAINWNNQNIAGELDLSGCTSLETVSCTDNPEIMVLNVSGCTSLTSINWPNGYLHELNIDGCTALTSFVFSRGYLEELDLTGCTRLSYISCWSYGLKHIKAYLNNTLVDLTAAGQGYIGLSYDGGEIAYATAVPNPWQFYSWNFEYGQTLSTEPDIELYLGGEENAIYTANFINSVTYNEHDVDKIRAFLAQGSNAQALGYDIDDPATWTDVDWGTAGEELRVTYISWYNNNLTGPLDLSGCESLKCLVCSGSTLGTLDVSGCAALYSLVCDNSGLTGLDISGCGVLQGLSCILNSLASLDVSGCGELESLSCDENSLTSLDVSGCRGLRILSCENNSLTSLDVSGFGELEWLYCKENTLETLDVSGCVNLIGLYCSNNALSELDLDGCEKLSALNCSGNNIASLDVSGCPIYYLVCSDNPLKIIRAKAEGKYITLAGAGGNVQFSYSVYYDEHDVRHIDELSAAAVPAELPFTGWTGERDGAAFVSGEAEIDLTPGAEYDITANFGYRVSYDGNGATQGTAPVSGGYGEGDAVTVCGNTGGLKKEGYELTGWNTAANGGGTHYSAGDRFLMPAHDVTLYAEWTPIVYRISYDLEGGLANNPESYTVETPSFTLTAPTRAGYRFTGWSGTGISGTAMSVTIAMGSTGDREYRANWETNSFTVSFDSQGGSAVKPVQAEGGATIAEPTAPSREGYTFGGWYKESSCSNAWNFYSDTVSANITLYAKWTPIVYQIIYDLNAGYALNPIYYTVESPSFTLNNPVRYGYNFTGWTGTGLAKETMVVTIPTGSTGHRMYIANWSVQQQSYYLAGVSLSSGSLNREFSRNVTKYKITLGENEGSLTLTPVKEYDGAAMTINKRAQSSYTVNLANGKSAKITVKVTLGRKSKTYTFTVTRAKSSNNYLGSLTATAGTWSQPFDPDVTNYTLTLDGNTNRTTIRAAAAAGKAARVSPASKKITLRSGQSKTFKITVRAQSGARRIYTITVARPGG